MLVYLFSHRTEIMDQVMLATSVMFSSSSFAKMLHALRIFDFIGSPSSYCMAEFSGWLSVVSAVQFLHAADSEVVLGGFS